MRNAMLLAIVSYLIGSFPTGYVITWLVKGMDIRSAGSGNIGATNVGRVLGHKWAVLVSVADMLKGALALLITGTSIGTSPWLLSLAGFAAVMGHNYPIWLRFRGGKGVATTYGVMFFLNPYDSFAVTLLSGAVWYAVMTSTRYVSLASMTSLFSMPIFFWMLDAPLSFIIVSLALAVFGLWRHSANIDRLVKGRESKV